MKTHLVQTGCNASRASSGLSPDVSEATLFHMFAKIVIQMMNMNKNETYCDYMKMIPSRLYC